MREDIAIEYSKGYFHNGDIINAPIGSIVSPSSNIVYDKRGKIISSKNNLLVDNDVGGTRSFALDNKLVGFLGNDDTSEKANGNLLQGSNKDLWFVGNNLSDTVKVWENFTTLLPIGGTNQEDQLIVDGTLSGGGTVDLTITGANIPSSPVTVTITLAGTETNSQTAQAFVDEIISSTSIDDEYYVYADTNKVILSDKTIRTNDNTLLMEIALGTATGLNENSSTNNATGTLDYRANLSTIPQVAKYNGSGWNNPVQVGLAPEEGTPTISLTTDSTRSAEFTGLITGSWSARVARKREGVISIASPKSEVITGDADSGYITIPLYTEDGSALEDREWVIYVTPTGRGSQDAHLTFPIYIPEAVMSGYENPDYFESKGQAKVKLISSSETVQGDRVLEIEFDNNELLLLQTFDDYYPLGACKFLQPLGNVMCGIGTGTDRTGFDVSYPNNRQAYPTEWRDWMKEVPVSVCSSADFGMFWILCSYNTYQAVWTGATQGTAPVVLRQVTNQYGAIGEGASITVNGVLYFISKGKIPVRISADRQVDDSFGNPVLGYFNTYMSSNAQIGYDEELNTVFFIDGTDAIGFQIDSGLWTSPNNLLDSTYGTQVLSTFSMDGKMHYCAMVDATSEIGTVKFDYDTAVDEDRDWVLVSSFYTGKYGLNLKDVIELRAVVESLNYTDTLTFKLYKNFNQSEGLETIATVTIDAITQTTLKELIEAIDYESVSLRIEGTKFRQTVHTAKLTIENHNIDKSTV